jgi:hypothetical protein
MANQNPDRRQMLQMIGLAVTASQLPGFSRWACAEQILATHAGHDMAAPPARAAAFKPKFFTAHEYATLEQLTELIIPKGESAGAQDAGVSEFIDLVAAVDPTIQAPFREGLRWLDGQASKQGAADFLHLSADKQTALLSQLAYRAKQVQDQEAGRAFFGVARRYTVMGYYTSKVGLQELDYPGLKLYAKSPACPHEDDREHRHLQAKES